MTGRAAWGWRIPTAFRRSRATPPRPQFQTTECGVGVLATMLAWFGRDIPMRDIRRVSGVSRDALTASDIRRTARAFGLDCTARAVEPDALADLGFPLVVHLRFIHFVVLEALDAQTARMNCPASGSLEMPRAEFDECFTGIALSMTPGPDFQPSRAAGMAASETAAWRWLARVAWPQFALAVCCALACAASAVMLAFAIAAPVPSAITISAAVLITALTHWAARCLSRHGERRLYRTLRARVVAHLSTMPDAFYVYRLPEVLVDVMRSSHRVAAALARQALPAFNGLVAMCVLLGGALPLDARVAAGFVICVAIWLVAVGFLLRARRGVERLHQQDPTGAVELAVTALRRPAFVRFADGLASFRLALTAKFARQLVTLDAVGAAPALLRAAPACLTLLCALIVLAASGASPVRADVGLIVIAAMLGRASRPLTELRGVLDRIRLWAFLLRDVLEEPSESIAPDTSASIGAGRIRVEDVSFAFANGRPAAVRDVSLDIAPGEQLGLTGPSGGGKSTLTELIAGRLRPTSGRVLARGVIRVGRDPVFFEGTIRENLTLWDPSITASTLAAAIRDACLDELLADRPDGLETRVEPFGRNFSGGQLQRLEIARALAHGPIALILDDAIDALDLATELDMREALRRRGCTVLLVSHRASSLAACDRVLRFAAGRLTGAGDDRAVTEPVSIPVKAGGLAIFSASASVPDQEPPIGDAAAALIAACDTVLPASVVPLWARPSDIADLDRSAAVARLAAGRGQIARRVRFVVPDMWTRDIGRLLAFRKDGAPVAIYPLGPRQFLFDPATNGVTRLEPARIAELAPVCYAFEPLHDHNQPNLLCWARSLIHDAGAELARLSICAAVTGGLLVLIVSAPPQPTGHFVAAAVLLGMGAVLFWHQQRVAAVRAEARLHRTVAALISDFAVRVDADAARTIDPSIAVTGLKGLFGLSERLLECARTGAAAVALLLCSIGALAWRGGGHSALLAGAAAALCFATEVLAPIVNQARYRRLASARLAADRGLVTLFNGIARLRGLAAADRAFSRWSAADDVASTMERRAGRVADLAAVPRTAALLLAIIVLGAAGGTLFAVLAWLVAKAAEDLGTLAGALIADRSSREAARQLLNLPREAGGIRVDTASAVITLERVSCRYPNTKSFVFTDLSLSIDPRAITVFSGPSGGGKSTLSRLILGLQRPDAGAVLVGGHVIDDVDLTHWRGRIAGVFQGDTMEWTGTIRGQFATTGEQSLGEIWAALDAVELSDEIRAMPMALQTIVEPRVISSGQQQRLLIARALSRKPAFLVMDEATNAIQDDLQARILGRLRARGIGCLIISHRETAIMAADQVHVIEAGRLVFSGSPESLSRRDDLNRRLYAEATE